MSDYGYEQDNDTVDQFHDFVLEELLPQLEQIVDTLRQYAEYIR